VSGGITARQCMQFHFSKGNNLKYLTLTYEFRPLKFI
jgi:hypothetical protein